MNALRLLAQLGEVEPVDERVLEAAVARVAAAASDTDRRVPVSRRPRWAGRRVLVPLAAAVVMCAAALTAVSWPGHPVPGSASGPAVRSGPAGLVSPGPPGVAAVLTAFSASRNDILMVTKVVRGEGSCCKSVILISPGGAPAGTTVRSRVENFTLAGARLADMALAYRAPAAAPGPRAGCGGIFGRPRIAAPPGTGFRGTATTVNYPARLWSEGQVRMAAATVPTAAGLAACLRDGQWRVLRPGAGARAIELVSSDGSGRMQISAATFLPDRLIETTPTPYGPTVISFTFSFLPPTAANETRLAVPVPAGFARMPLPG